MQHTRTYRRVLVSLFLVVFVVGLGQPAGLVAGMPDPEPAAGEPPPIELLASMAQADPLTKIEGRLRDIALEASAERLEYIVVMSAGPVDLGAFSDFVHQFTWPAGEHVSILRVPASDILAIAALPGVYDVSWGDPDAPLEPPFEERPFEPLDPAEMRARLDAAPPWSETAKLLATQSESKKDVVALARDRGGAQPDGWYDVEQGHAAREAWEMGYTGEGVTVAVLDYAIDFAHPDLQGTWKVLPEGHPYAGWPQAFDPVAGYQRVLDGNRSEEQQSTRTALTGMIEVYQTSPVEEREIGGEMVDTACFQPLLYLSATELRVLGPEACDYVVPESRSGQVRFGHHPDTVLRSFGADPDAGILGEWAGVLLVDANTPGVYDTVYVDLNNDHDFTDEKPTTKDDPLAWRDVSDPADGIADLTGGLLYFVADGELPFPGSWLWGLEEEIPAAGTVIGLHYATGGHGTMCGSNVVSQGRLGVPEDRRLEFRDLPGDGRPPSVNLGLAPGAKMVSIGSVYSGPDILFEASWRYAVLGHDPERDDDLIQVTSNSYGFSDIDNDGWEPSARLVDYYVRSFSPETSFLFSTGNGGPGYGTIAPPSPSVSMGIAASTQFGSTGYDVYSATYDSITDTLQITFGDIVSFSNRGPGANGSNGPTVAADGAYASGAVPINAVTAGGGDGSHALATWGGTSRAGPVANGALALAYDAFREANGRWPTWEEARAILMSGARFAGYDTFTLGAGVVDAGDSVRIASGRHGIYAVPAEWTAGSYRGETYPAFAKIMLPGDSENTSITVHNPSAEPVEVSLSGQTLRRIGSYHEALTTTLDEESPRGAVADYLIPIDREKIPEGTELMVVRGTYPLAELDPNGDIVGDNYFMLGVMQHTDVNGNGRLWEDRNGNGVVNHRSLTDSFVVLNWADQTKEIDSLEGAITVPLEEEGLEAEIAWYGKACNDNDGEAPPPAQDINERLALIERGDCRFDEKIPNAETFGAIGAVLFTDERAKTSMGGSSAGITIPGVMIDREPGLALKDLLDAGTVVTAGLYSRQFIGQGIDGGPPVKFKDTEIEQYEYMRMAEDSGQRNTWAASVHHPLERWSDGLYIALWHMGRSAAITNTHISFRLDSYAYEDWTLLTLSDDTVTVPAAGEVAVEATMALPEDVPYGGYQGAIFADYVRGEGDEPVKAPGGYELEHQRVVIPVNVNVAPRYEWEGAVTLGGEAAADLDAPYGNGTVRGAFYWNWRPESGDWRFFFLDATEPPDGTYWLFRTMWEDENAGQADIDTRVWGPLVDQFSNPEDLRNAETDYSDPGWYGPYTLGLLTQSPNLVMGWSGRYPFQTSSGGNDDWLAAPAGEGLHEVMLDNVLFSGTQFEMPFETSVSSLQIGASPALFGDACAEVKVTSQMDMPDFTTRGFGLSVPEVFTAEPISQDDPGDRTSSSFKHDVVLATEAGRFEVTLHGEDDDDLDMMLMYDGNSDGQFDYPAEQLVISGNADSNEFISLPGFSQPGHYQVWVHGYAVVGEESTFDLEIDVVSGDSIQVGRPARVVAGRPTSFEVCADTATLEGEDGPAYGIVVFGPGGAPALFQLPVTWMRDKPAIYLPASVQNWEFGAESAVPPGP